MAALCLLLLLAAPSEPRQETFVFPAEAGRIYTGIYIERGERVKITADGAWTMWAEEFGRSNAIGHRFRVGNFGWGRLMGRVGSGEELSVGTSLDWTSSESGVLVLYPNVGDYGIRGGDGALTITVTGGTPLEEHLERLAADGARVSVPADTRGLITDVYVRQGDEISIDAFGEWRMYEDGPLVTAAGDLSRRLADTTPWGRLTARVGGPTFAGGEDYDLGEGRIIRPRRNGLLELRPKVGPYAGHRRSGRIEVIIRGGTPADERLRAAAATEAASYERALGFLHVHQYRRHLSLAPSYAEPALMRAAQAHAEALARGEADELRPRLGEEGFAGELTGVAVHGYTDGVAAVDGFWRAPYHRAMIAEPDARAVGVGVARGERAAFVLLLGRSENAPAHQVPVPEVALFPKAGQTNVTTSWTGRSDPSPFPEPPPGAVGFPASATFTTTTVTAIRSARMADTRGQQVACLPLGPGADPHDRLRRTVFVLPLAPLTQLETYEVQMAVDTPDGPREVSWRFTCGLDREAVLPAPQLNQPSNPVIDLGRGEVQFSPPVSADSAPGGRSRPGPGQPGFRPDRPQPGAGPN